MQYLKKFRLLRIWSALIHYKRIDNKLYYLKRSIIAVVVGRWHPHRRVDRWRRSRPVRSASWAGVILGAAPAETNTGVSNGVTLHLVDSHFCSMMLHELDEATSFAWRNSDVGNFTKSLEGRSKKRSSLKPWTWGPGVYRNSFHRPNPKTSRHSRVNRYSNSMTPMVFLLN